MRTENRGGDPPETLPCPTTPLGSAVASPERATIMVGAPQQAQPTPSHHAAASRASVTVAPETVKLDSDATIAADVRAEQQIRYALVVSAHNTQQTIEVCLSPLGEQPVSPEAYEVILVDNGSIDA